MVWGGLKTQNFGVLKKTQNVSMVIIELIMLKHVDAKNLNLFFSFLGVSTACMNFTMGFL